MKAASKKVIDKSAGFAEELIRFANENYGADIDNGCEILLGVIRDYGYRIRTLTNNEKSRQEKSGEK